MVDSAETDSPRFRNLRFAITVETDAADEDFIATIKGRYEDGRWPDTDGVTALRDLLYEAICEEDFFLDKFPPSTSISIEANTSDIERRLADYERRFRQLDTGFKKTGEDIRRLLAAWDAQQAEEDGDWGDVFSAIAVLRRHFGPVHLNRSPDAG